MKGRVEYINSRRGMVAVLTDEGYSIIEMLGDGLEIGNLLQWEGHPLGGENIQNLSTGKMIDVYFQNHWVTKEQLTAQLLLQ